jgi:formate dehydrogenase iron-sulfur subunit
MYGPREEIQAEAHARADAMRERYPNAQVYGETQLDGLGMIVVTPDDPGSLDIPLDPKKPFMADVWQKVVQPGAVALTLGATVLAGVGGVIARRRHQEELVVLEAEGVIEGDDADTEQEEG